MVSTTQLVSACTLGQNVGHFCSRRCCTVQDSSRICVGPSVKAAGHVSGISPIASLTQLVLNVVSKFGHKQARGSSVTVHKQA